MADGADHANMADGGDQATAAQVAEMTNNAMWITVSQGKSDPTFLALRRVRVTRPY